MSHFTVMVIGENPEKQLAPYQENNMGNCPEEYLSFVDETEYLREGWNRLTDEEKNEYGNSFIEYAKDEGYKKHQDEERYGSYENINAKWDWYVLGGRWTGFLKLKAGAEGQVGEAGLMTSSARPGFGDSAIKNNIDFDGMRKSEAEDAGKTWDKVTRILGDVERPYSWEYVRETMFPGKLQEARDYYNNQAANKKIDEWNRKNNHSLFGVNPLDFMITKEEHCAKAAESAISTFAVLKDGVWYSNGETGWWGTVSGEKDQSDWNKEISKMIESLDGDTLISIYDCHI